MVRNENLDTEQGVSTSSTIKRTQLWSMPRKHCLLLASRSSSRLGSRFTPKQSLYKEHTIYNAWIHRFRIRVQPPLTRPPSSPLSSVNELYSRRVLWTAAFFFCFVDDKTIKERRKKWNKLHLADWLFSSLTSLNTRSGEWTTQRSNVFVSIFHYRDTRHKVNEAPFNSKC